MVRGGRMWDRFRYESACAPYRVLPALTPSPRQSTAAGNLSDAAPVGYHAPAGARAARPRAERLPTMASETREARDFNEVELKGFGTLHLTQGETEALRLESDEETLAQI